MHTKAFPYIGLLGFFWGTNIVASRFGIGEFNPYLFLALRLSIASLAFLGVFLLRNGRFPNSGRTWGYATLSGVLGVTIPMSTFILSLQYQSSGVASIYVTTSPALIAIAAHLFLPDERMSRNKAAGVSIALLGSLFLVLLGESGLANVERANPLGVILIMSGLLSETFNTILVRKRMTSMDPTQITAVRLLVGAVCLILLALFMADFNFSGITGAGYFSLLYAALIGAAAGQFMAFYIQRRFGATAFSLVSFVVPVVATSIGVLLLGEIVTGGMLVGVVLIGTGIYLINRPKFDAGLVKI